MLNPNSDSRRIFFLYPHLETENKIALEIFSNEYETFLINDHSAARKLASEMNKSFIFVNIDKPVKNLGWIQYINEINQLNADKNILIGTISNESKNGESYKPLPHICVSFDHGIGTCTETILKVLEKDNARGKRKYVRAKCDNTYRSTFSIKKNKSIHVGAINDISIFAMACTFLEKMDLEVNAKIDDLQLRLDGKTIRTAGEIIAKREKDNMYIIKFDPFKILPVKNSIHTFIFNAMQRALHNRLKELNQLK